MAIAQEPVFPSLERLATPLSATRELDRRGRIGSFLLSSLRRAGPQYQDALRSFNNELLQSRGCPFDALSPEDQDWTLADKILDLYENTFTAEGLARAAVLLAACSKVNPHRKYRVSWKCLDAWRTRCPPKQAPAMPRQFAMAAVTWLVVAGKPALALAVLLCFCGLLRASEALQLRRDNLVRVCDAWVLVLGETKRGQEQKVVLTAAEVCRWVDSYFHRYPCSPSARVIPHAYNTFQLWLRKCMTAMSCAHLPWSTHSLRRGGASEMARVGIPMADIMAYGRWASSRAAQEYVRRGEVALLQVGDTFPPEAWSTTRCLARIGAEVWSTLDDSSDSEG